MRKSDAFFIIIDNSSLDIGKNWLKVFNRSVANCGLMEILDSSIGELYFITKKEKVCVDIFFPPTTTAI